MPTRRARLAAYLVPLALVLVPVDIQRCCPPAHSPATDVQRAQWRFPWSPCRGVRGCPRYFCRPCPSRFPSSRVGTRPCPHTSTCTRTCTSRVASVPSLLPVCRLSPPQGRTFHCLVSALTPVRSRAAIKAGAPHALASPTPARPLPLPPPFHLLLYCTSVFCSSLPWHPCTSRDPIFCSGAESHCLARSKARLTASPGSLCPPSSAPCLAGPHHHTLCRCTALENLVVTFCVARIQFLR